MFHPRCPDEPLLEKGYVHDFEKYVKEHKRLFTMDHFYPYGPWSTDSPSWQHFLDALYKSSRETASMGTCISQRGTGPLIVYPPRRWEIRPQVGERVVISRTHPTMDKILSGIVNKVSNDSFHVEWKTQWGQFGEFSDKVQPEDKQCPNDHFRVDMEIESISTTPRASSRHSVSSQRFKAMKNWASPYSPRFRPC